MHYYSIILIKYEYPSWLLINHKICILGAIYTRTISPKNRNIYFGPSIRMRKPFQGAETAHAWEGGPEWRGDRSRLNGSSTNQANVTALLWPAYYCSFQMFSSTETTDCLLWPEQQHKYDIGLTVLVWVCRVFRLYPSSDAEPSLFCNVEFEKLHHFVTWLLWCTQ